MKLMKDELNFPIGQQDIHIIPVISGAGDGFGRFLLGAALIGAIILFPRSRIVWYNKFSWCWCCNVVGVSSAGVYLATAIGTGLSAIGAGH